MIDLSTLPEAPSPAYFLSDCHLPILPRPDLNDWAPLVVEFLRREASQARSLFIVGDLFDFWFEWRHVMPARSFPVLAALHELVRRGIEVHYLAGNHDGHLWRHLSEQVCVSVHRGNLDVIIDGKAFHIIHGDGVAAKDRGYRMLRSLVRWGPTETIYRLLHPDLGTWLAGRVSKLSREHLSQGDRFGPEPYRAYAQTKIDQGFHYVVMGHRHAAEHLHFPQGEYLAIGNWIGERTYGVFEGRLAEIRNFNNSRNLNL